MVYMVSGKPVLATIDIESDSAKAIRDSQSGWIRSPEDIDSLADSMRSVVNTSPTELRNRGMWAREYAMKNYSRHAGVQKVVQFISQLIK